AARPHLASRPGLRPHETADLPLSTIVKASINAILLSDYIAVNTSSKQAGPSVSGVKRHSMDSRSIGRKSDNVKRDRRSNVASCPPILHDAGNRGSRHGRALQDGGGRDRPPPAGTPPRPMDHLRQRPCRAVLSHCCAALYDPCRRRG